MNEANGDPGAVDLLDEELQGDQDVSGVLGSVSRVFWVILTAIGVLSVAGLFFTVIVDVVLRYTAGSGIPGGNDMVSSWWMVSIAFVGIALAQHSRGRIQVDFLVDALPPRMRRIVDTAIFTVVCVIGLVLVVATFQEALHQMDVGEYAPIGHRPIWPFRFMAPLGFLGFSFACVLSIVSVWQVAAREHAASVTAVR
ncbi:TRAP transporter small permease [Microbacterium sp. CPCC 204701]|uniref:TRAP transporter small permease n=1 Tax=Microbacterium sp. CPCC 204701 TaxID=2493084 RepID=UPI000FDA21E8|nr:TRAP transporter small permease [Microbacterium sp. CPCC 204701]